MGGDCRGIATAGGAIAVDAVLHGRVKRTSTQSIEKGKPSSTEQEMQSSRDSHQDSSLCSQEKVLSTLGDLNGGERRRKERRRDQRA